jgi:hypothetical protein
MPGKSMLGRPREKLILHFSFCLILSMQNSLRPFHRASFTWRLSGTQRGREIGSAGLHNCREFYSRTRASRETKEFWNGLPNRFDD